jgi:Zn-finger in ubiquitin-hydrolases and other protein
MVPTMCTDIDPAIPPSGEGCAECLAGEGAGWWLHLRRCAACGHVGCCDSSPSRHSRAHWERTGHPVIQSFEPGEDWFWSWPDDALLRGPELAPPTSHPPDQPTPGPAGQVPPDWMRLLH